MADQIDTSRRDMLSLGALTAASALGAGLLAPSVARADSGVTGLKIGLVDIGVVFKNYKRKDDLEKSINAKKENYEKQAREQESTLENMRKGLTLTQQGSDLYRQKSKEIKLQMSQMKVIRDGWEEELKIQVENLTLQILNEIENRVSKYGADNRFDLIVKIDSQGWGDERFQERIFRAQVSSVLYFSPNLDVTSQVLALLNDAQWIADRQNEKPLPQVDKPK